MTDRKELEALQKQARADGRTCNFFFDEEGRLDQVFYADPKAKSLLKGGLILPLISFAEMERKKRASDLYILR